MPFWHRLDDEGDGGNYGGSGSNDSAGDVQSHSDGYGSNNDGGNGTYGDDGSSGDGEGDGNIMVITVLAMMVSGDAVEGGDDEENEDGG